MVPSELLVVVEFNASKTLDEIEFSFIPIWAKVAKLTMGLMNKDTTQAIGDEVGVFVEMESESDEIGAGRFLRLKVKLDIRKPLMWEINCWAREKKIDGALSHMNFFPTFAIVGDLKIKEGRQEQRRTEAA